MSEPKIAVIGSADASRTFNPPLKAAEEAKKAAELLGRELASSNCRMIVYSSNPTFIEGDFVRGYVSGATSELKGAIEVHYPLKKEIEFKEQEQFPELFALRPNQKTSWEVSFYQSLNDADGIIFIGGGRSTLISGLMAIELRIPLLALAAFGAGGQKVWELLTPDNCWATQNEIEQMGRWNGESSAKAWVEALLQQRRSRLNHQEMLQRQKRAALHSANRTALVSAGVFVVILAVAAFAFSGAITSYTTLVMLLFFCPLLAGISGSTIRSVFDWTQGEAASVNRSTISTVVLGLIVGGISGLLFVLAQITTLPDLQGLEDLTLKMQQAQRLIPFTLVLGFLGGLTLDTVMRKLIDVDVVDPTAITMTNRNSNITSD